MLLAAHIPLASKGSFLISTNVGIMIWTVVVFVISMFILRRAVFPRIGEALDSRAKVIAGDIDAAQETREKAEQVLDEYRERLKEARVQSDEIVQRARQTAETHEKEAKERGREMITEASKRAQRDIETATKRALDDLRREVADLTIMAAE
jgi:F-type H+-transporting ATPase subunit b